MNTINFSHNWNGKLGTHIFTTIRKYSKEKLDYYEKQVGEIFAVNLKGQKKVGGNLLSVRHEKKLIHIDPELLMVDTGMPTLKKALEIFALFGIKQDDPVIILLVEGGD